MTLTFDEGGTKQVCSLLLRMTSPVWDRMLASGMKEACQGTVTVGASKEDFDAFYGMLLPGASRVMEHESEIDGVLALSEYYQVDFVKEACETKLLQLPTSVERLLQAEKYGLAQQYERCIKAAATTYTEEQLKQLRRCSPDALERVAVAMRNLLS